MPHTFVQVGPFWLNLDLVTSVELVDDPQSPGQYRAARIHFTTGKKQDFRVQEDVKELADWLRAHKAP